MILTLFWAETRRESRAALRRDKESRLSALRFIPLHTSLPLRSPSSVQTAILLFRVFVYLIPLLCFLPAIPTGLFPLRRLTIVSVVPNSVNNRSDNLRTAVSLSYIDCKFASVIRPITRGQNGHS